VGERGVADAARRVEATIARHGAAVLRVANQFSLCHDDALDAYQRALEIYLRRLATVDPATEGAWLRVVAKHEAMAIRRARLDSVNREDVDLDTSVHHGLREVDDEVAGGERVDRSVEALRALRPDEARALLLKAEGLSYHEIGRHFGWTYTKVNRSITQGRARFLRVFSRLEEGEECSAHEAALHALATGTATSADVVSIRPHLRHCATCRAAVRDMRFSRLRRLALLLPFGWLARSEVALYSASTGGGRFGPAAALLGICLGGGFAGAACVMTGAVPAPPLVASKPPPRKAPPRAATVKRVPARVAKATPTPVATAAAFPRATATPVRVQNVRKRVRKRRAPPAVRRGEFTFEGAGATTPAAPRASAASVRPAGGGAKRPVSSSGGGEFGFEDG